MRENEAKKFTRDVKRALREPANYPSNHPKLKDAKVISTKGNLMAIVYGTEDESPLAYAHQKRRPISSIGLKECKKS